MHYTNVLLSQTDWRFYTGTTGELQKRLPAEDAYRRERFLKSGKGGRYQRSHLASSLSELWKNKLDGISL